MSREWKPGDVAVVEIADDTFVGPDEIAPFMEELIRWWPRRPRHEVGINGGTAILEFIARAFRGAKCGRLVTIDPEDREQVERLRKAVDEAREPQYFGLVPPSIERMQDALRSLIDPPRPEEPTGLGAVVEDADGRRWTRANSAGEWFSHDGDDVAITYDEVPAVRVLSEGVQS